MFKPDRPFSVFYYYFFSFAAAVVALLAWMVFWPEDVPERNGLIMSGGEVETVRIYDDISDSGAGASLPILTTVYFRFKGIEGEFRYPWKFPNYRNVKDHAAVYIDIWVEKQALGGDDAPLIWALQEINPHKDKGSQTSVLFEDVARSQQDIYQTVIRFCLYMLGASVLLALIGIWISRWNHRNFPDYDPN